VSTQPEAGTLLSSCENIDISLACMQKCLKFKFFEHN